MRGENKGKHPENFCSLETEEERSEFREKMMTQHGHLGEPAVLGGGPTGDQLDTERDMMHWKENTTIRSKQNSVDQHVRTEVMIFFEEREAKRMILHLCTEYHGPAPHTPHMFPWFGVETNPDVSELIDRFHKKNRRIHRGV